MNKIVEVKLDCSSNNLFFDCSNLKLNTKNTVVVDTGKGIHFGKVVRIIDDINQFDGVELGNVIRITTKKDYYNYLDNKKMANDALKVCRGMVLKERLDMSIIDAYYDLDRTQLTFRFVAVERVDFRQLAKDLGSIFHSRIELRQIGIRDKAKEVGGIGPCGRLLCCTSYLKNFDSVTINMAKNQNVSLNPTKINGVCGRLLCCLKYENDYYSSTKKKMPKVGEKVSYNNQEGKVISIDLLKCKYIVELENNEKVEVDLNESKK